MDGSWLLPDVVMLGYLAVAGIGMWMETQTPLLTALIWGAHIGMDRALGSGLKHATGFKDTHLNRA